MEDAIKWYSIRAPSGALLASVMLHLGISVGVVAMLSTGVLQSEAPVTNYEIGYEILEEPPASEKTVQPVRREIQPPPIAVPVKTPVTTLSQEIQDEKSAVVGTQTAAQVQPVAGAQGTGTSVPLTPYYKVKPKYPKAALVSGDQGWVLMKIDVTENGEVENVRIIDGEKKNLFADEARRAVAKWKYRPFLDGSGNPVRKADHEVRVDFRLDEA